MRFYCTSTGPIGGLNCEGFTVLHLCVYVFCVYIHKYLLWFMWCRHGSYCTYSEV